MELEADLIFHPQQQPSGSNNTGSEGTTVLIGNNATQNSLVNAVAAALQNKNRRRSTPTDFNK